MIPLSGKKFAAISYNEFRIELRGSRIVNLMTYSDGSPA
jgi:hypothetical protein